MPFIPHTSDDVSSMLQSIGVSNVEDLFSEIPSTIERADLSSVPRGITEMEMLRILSERAKKDEIGPCFAGAGSYDHHIPAAVWDLASRGEYLTPYTPYQAEASQGTLQVLYEFQTMMSSLTGMDVANASVYDGGSGLAEAILMAVRCNRRNKSRKVLICGGVNPFYLQAANTLVCGQGIELIQGDLSQGTYSIDLGEADEICAVVVQQPNFFGLLEDIDEICDWARTKNALVIAVVNPMTLAVLKPPGEWGTQGADICCGDGQPLGVPMSSGGPSFGFLCTKLQHVRQLPGRIVGRTADSSGDLGYTLTLQAREQHIRRAKATSNICTNQGLLVTAATIYMALMGLRGLGNVASTCHTNTKYVVDRLCKSGQVETTYSAPYFHECALDLKCDAQVVCDSLLREESILAGYPLGKSFPGLQTSLLVCSTERRTQGEMDQFIGALLNTCESFCRGQ
ncbi:MAG: aminomethyl-transferring glycine dehydrogenase subunit GcvPA [Gammaproteobacteria bacterium]|nr:aminomethyl-transferring glycine dehydrogenase subunit GcvPA [Gammaproteobacteria bacterium]